MASTATTAGGPHRGLLDWLASQHIEYEVHEHPLAYTARETARVEGVDPRTFAKVVGVATDAGQVALVVIDATDHVDLPKVAHLLEAGSVRLLTEAELTALAPDCDAGAIPAVGQLYGLRVLADHAVRHDPEISFNAGSHRYSVRVDRASWEKAADVTYADLTGESDTRPAWAR